MDAHDYLIAWILYCVAAVVLSLLAWIFFRRYLWRELAYLFEGWLLAIFFTPVRVLVDHDIMAPAIVVFAMDTLTINAAAGVRALIPLVMAMAGMLVAAVLLSIVHRIRLRRTLLQKPLNPPARP